MVQIYKASVRVGIYKQINMHSDDNVEIPQSYMLEQSTADRPRYSASTRRRLCQLPTSVSVCSVRIKNIRQALSFGVSMFGGESKLKRIGRCSFRYKPAGGSTHRILEGNPRGWRRDRETRRKV
jgi:hypothetical protein